MEESTHDIEERQAGPPDVDSDDEQRIVVTLTGDAYRKLKGTADRSQSTVADLVKNGLALAEWLEEENVRGGQLLVKRGGRLRELTLPGHEDDSSR
jgi:hypothetical protein